MDKSLKMEQTILFDSSPFSRRSG